MNKKELIEHLQKGERMMVTNARIITPGGSWEGSGVMTQLKGRFKIEIHFPEGIECPPLPTGTIMAKDFWNMEGVLENSLNFSIPSLPPCHSQRNENGTRNSATFHTGSIELEPTGVDCMTHAEITRLLDSLNHPKDESDEDIQKRLAPGSESGTAKGNNSDSAMFKGVLRNFQVLARNAGSKETWENDFFGKTSSSSLDTCHGNLDDEWEFGLMQRGDNVEFLLKSKDGYRSTGEEEDMRRFQAFMAAVGFLYGKNAWPSRLEYRKAGRLILDRISAFEPSSGSPHLPFPERLWFNAMAGEVSCDISDVFSKAYRFFERKNILSETIAKILFYLRESTKREVHNKVRTMSLCALLEHLVRAICRHEIRSVSNEQELRTILAEYDVPTLSMINAGRQLESLVKKVIKEMKNPKPFTACKLFHRAFKITNQAWDQKAQDAFNYWKSNRNKLLHDGDHESDQTDELLVESRLAGAINILVLKLMGYSGITLVSAFEDNYRKI